MRRSAISWATLVGAPILASAALAAPAAWGLSSSTVKTGPPSASTGSVAQVRGTSVQLQGAVDPHSLVTTYFFKYGPTAAYGSSTPNVTLPAGPVKIRVGQTVRGFLPGYHYRIVARNSAGSREGRDRIYTAKSSRLQFQVPKTPEPTVFGSSFVLRGALTGTANANHRIVLQSSPYPYLTPFEDVALPTVTDSAGHFTFHVLDLTASTQFRVSTLDPRPVYSPLVTEHVAVRVTLKVRSTSRKGLYRLYGTISPAEVGARVYFQLLKPVRPGKTEKTEKTARYSAQFSTVAKRATKKASRFSMVESVRRAGRYRAFVQVRKGGLVAGSSASLVLKAASTTPKSHAKKH